MLLLQEDEQGKCSQLKNHYASMQANFEFASIKSYVEQAQIKYIKKIIGNDLLQDILTKQEAETLTGKEELLLHHLQRALTYYTLASNLTFLDSVISEAGATQTNANEVTALPQWKFAKIQKDLYDAADDFAEVVLEFLEENKDDFPIWTNSNEYLENKELLINSAKELSQYVIIAPSRRLFLRIKIILKIKEQTEIVNLIGKDFLQELKILENPTELEANIITYLKQILACATLQTCLTSINLTAGENGFFVSSYDDGILKKTSIDEKTKAEMLGELKQTKEQHIVMLKKMLENNIDSFPTYKNSNYYKPPQEKTLYGRDENNFCNKSFVL